MRKRNPRRTPRGTLGGAVLLLRRSHQGSIRESLSRPLNTDDQHRLLLPARISAVRLRSGHAEQQDLHNLVAFLNVGSVLARDTGENEAFSAVQAGVLALCAIKDRPGPRYAMNPEQRTTVLQAVDLVDELFCCTTLLEISAAHRKIMAVLPLTGDLKLLEVEVA